MSNWPDQILARSRITEKGDERGRLGSVGLKSDLLLELMTADGCSIRPACN